MQAVVLAGGRGTRLQSVVQDVPKPMAPVNGRPFLEFVLNGLKGSGFTEVVLSVGYKRNIIMKHFGADYAGMQILYAVEDEPLGTGGAIRLALEQVPPGPVFVLNGDTLLSLDYHAMLECHQGSGARLSIAAARLLDVCRYGTLEVNGGWVQSLVEKGRTGPGLINAGTYLMDSGLLSGITPGSAFSFEKEILEPMAKTGSIAAFVTDGYFIDIGIPEDYFRVQNELGGAR